MQVVSSVLVASASGANCVVTSHALTWSETAKQQQHQPTNQDTQQKHSNTHTATSQKQHGGGEERREKRSREMIEIEER